MFEPGEIKTFKISNGALKGKDLPTRIKILNWGDNDTIDGVYRVGDKTSAQLSANQKRFGFERVAIDFNHCTVPGTDTYNELMKAGQPPLIFGYGRVNLIPGEGPWLEDITWTPLGQQHARNFEDLSPALKDDGREVTMIHSVALTPNGKVKDLQFFSAHQSNQNTMKQPIICEELVPILGLKADCTRADVLARLGLISTLASVITIKDGKITTLSGLVDEGKLIITIPEPAALAGLGMRLKTLEDAGTKNIATLSATINGKVRTFSAEDLVGLIAKVEDLAGRFTSAETAATARERDQVIKRFSADGKVPKKADGSAYTAEELIKLPVDTLQLLHANTPVTVALAARGATSQTDGAKNKYRDDKGRVDLAAMFNDENAAGN